MKERLRLEPGGAFHLKEGCLAQPDWVFRVAGQLSFAPARVVEWMRLWLRKEDDSAQAEATFFMQSWCVHLLANGRLFRQS